MTKQKKQEITELNQKKNFLGKLSELFINRYRMSYLMIMMIVVVGFSAYNALPRESMPDVTLPYAMVTTVYSGAGPEDVETLVTDEIESAISELDDVEEITSTSYLGYSIVSIEFASGVDMDLKKVLLQNELNELRLPDDVNDPMVHVFATSEMPIMRMSITGDYDMYALTQIAEDIQDQIERVDGVGNVEVNGGLDQEIHIYIDPVKLNNYGLSLTSIQASLATANINTPLGDDTLDGLYYNIRVDEQFKSIEDIERVLLTTGSGDLIFLKDIADIVDTHEDPEETAAVYLADDTKKPSAFSSVNISVEREDGADVVGSSQAIREMLEEERGMLYPEDLTIHISYDQADDVSEDLHDVTENAMSGLIVVVIVLFLFIGFSESLIVAFVIPLSMMSALAIMNYSGITLNSLSILGLIVSLGLLVDNAIVIMENIDRMRHLGLDRLTASKVGTNQVALSVFAATLTTVAAFVPLTLLPGMMGAFVKSIPQAVIITILASLTISLMITPTICSRHLPKQKKSKWGDKLWVRISSIILVVFLCGHAFRVDGEVGIIAIAASVIFGTAMYIKQFKFHDRHLEEATIIKWYEKTLRKIVSSKAKRFMMIGGGVALLILSLATLPTGILKVEMMPDDDPTSIEISMEAPQGTSLETMENITEEAQEILYKIPEIESFSVTVGGNEKNTSSINAELIDEKLREKDGMEVLELIREQVSAIPGARIIVKASAQGPPTSDYDISIEFIGEDMEMLRASAEEHLKVLSGIEGIVSPQLNVQNAAPQIQFDIHNNKAKALGLTPSDIASELRTYINGATATTVKFENTEVDVIIKMNDDEIVTTEQLNHLFITLKNGDKIPVSVVADIVEVDGLSEIIHDDFDRVIKVQGDLETGYNSNMVLAQFKEGVKDLILPDGVQIQYGGEAEDIAENFGNLGQSMILAVILVYGILAIQFNSITQPFVIVMTIPMATIGVILGLLVTGNNFGFYAFMGLVSLVGIAVNDAIVLVDYINYLRSVGKNLIDAIVEAGKTRFIPVFSTTITTCGGILPLAVKNPYYAQLGYSLIFGLMVATVLTLVFIPIFYAIIEGRKLRKKERKEKRAMEKTLADVEV